MRKFAHLLTALPALTLLAGCEAQQEEGAEAIQAAAAVREIPVTTASDEARGIFMEGQHALDMGREQEARELFARAAEIDPQFTYAYVRLSTTAASPQEFMRNLELAEANLAGASDGERLLVAINRTHVDVDVAQRLQLANQLVEAYPASPRAWLTLAEVQTNLREIEDARASLEKALELDPDFAPTHISLGWSYLDYAPKDLAKGEEHMRRVVELEPEEANAHISLGDAYRTQNLLEDARDSYAEAAELDPSSHLAHSKKGHANTFIGEYEEARADFERAMELAQDQSKAAWASYRAFIDTYAGDPGATVEELGSIYDSIDELGIPEDQLTVAKINVLWSQAMIALHHGFLDVGEQTIERLSEHIRTNAAAVGDEDFTRSQEADIVGWHGYLAAYRGDFETARSMAEEIARLVEPQTSPRKMEGYHGLLAFVALRAGDYQLAVEHYRQTNLNNPIFKHHLALALEGAGELDEAFDLFKEVAEFNFNSAAYACVRTEAIQKVSELESRRTTT